MPQSRLREALMSDWDDICADAREEAAEDHRRRINARRAWQAMQGPPGDPPEFIEEE